MNPIEFAKANGWPQLVARTGVGVRRRVRDGLTAQRLRAPGFRAGSAPRLLGLSHMQVGPDFNAGDALWLEAVLAYGNQRFTPKLVIGAHARLSDSVHIGCIEQVTIGDHLLSGSHVLISDHAHGSYGSEPDASDPAVPPAKRPLHSAGSVVIGHNVWLGNGVAVLAGAQIGDGCVIGANAVVTSPIPARTVAVGAPARPVRRWNEVTRSWVPLSQADATA